MSKLPGAATGPRVDVGGPADGVGSSRAGPIERPCAGVSAAGPALFVASGDAAAGSGAPPTAAASLTRKPALEAAPATAATGAAAPTPQSKFIPTPWRGQGATAERPLARRCPELASSALPEQAQSSQASAASGAAVAAVHGDGPGLYRIVRNTFASSGVALGCEKVQILEEGVVIKVLEVVYSALDKRIRGRIEEPGGWVSLLDTESGARYAERQAAYDTGSAKEVEGHVPVRQLPLSLSAQEPANRASEPAGAASPEAAAIATAATPEAQLPSSAEYAVSLPRRVPFERLPSAFWKAPGAVPTAAANDRAHGGPPAGTPAVSPEILASLPPGALEAVPIEPEQPGAASGDAGGSSGSCAALASVSTGSANAGGTTAAPAAGAVAVEQLQLPRMVEEPSRGLDESKFNEAQINIVKELAGGARFHDPARDRWACREQARNTCLIDVRKLRFCHATISPHFMHGQHRGLPVLSLLEDLHAGKADPRQLPPMVVMRTNKGLDVVCGNRRLYCLKRYAAEASTCVNAWCIVYDLKAQDTPRPLVMKYILAATTRDGGSIQLRNL